MAQVSIYCECYIGDFVFTITFLLPSRFFSNRTRTSRPLHSPTCKARKSATHLASLNPGHIRYHYRSRLWYHPKTRDSPALNLPYSATKHLPYSLTYLLCANSNPETRNHDEYQLLPPPTLHIHSSCISGVDVKT